MRDKHNVINRIRERITPEERAVAVDELRDLTDHHKRDKCLLWMAEKNPAIKTLCKKFDLAYSKKLKTDKK